MRKSTIFAALLAASTLASIAVSMPDPPCVEAGQTVEHFEERPAIDAPGMPVGAKWEHGNGGPELWDRDAFGSPDLMGNATLVEVTNEDGSTTTKACATIRNVGGEMVGPNGADVTGAFDGDCVEVYVVWFYRYTRTETRCISHGSSVGSGGSGVSEEETNCYQVTVHCRGWVRPNWDHTTQYCPC